MKQQRSFFTSIFLVLLLIVLGACQSDNKLKTDVTGFAEDNVEYFGNYMKVKEGELDGDYFDDYEAVPLQDYNGHSIITLKSTGTYEHEVYYYSEEYGDVYREITNKYEYYFDENEVVRERNITTDNFKSHEKIYKNDDGNLRVKDDYLDRLADYNAKVLKEEADYVIYERTEYAIANSDSDQEENHLEYDFITVEGNLISVNYYKDDDRTRISVYDKID